MPEVSGPFRAALEERRDHYNALFRRSGAGLDADAFLAHLAEWVAPVVNAAGDARADAVTRALYGVSFHAFRKRLLGPSGGSPILHRVFRDAYPRLGPHLAAAPERVAQAVGNAALHLERALPGSAGAWLDALVAIASDCPDADALLDAGALLAWRHGLAELREAALFAAGRLPKGLTAAILGGDEIARDDRHRFVRPGGSRALGEPRVLHMAGGFLGFGGPFLRPPLVFAQEGGIYALESQAIAHLHADVFGARLVIAGEPEGEEMPRRPKDPRIDQEGNVSWEDVKVHIPELARCTSQVHHAGVLAVTLPASHHVFVVGRPGR